MAEGDRIMEVMEEEMSSPVSGFSHLKIAYFIRPSVSSIDGHFFAPPVDIFKQCVIFDYLQMPSQQVRKIVAIHLRLLRRHDVVGVFFVLGGSVFGTVGNEELEMITEKLLEARLDICWITARKASLSDWMLKFMDCESEIMHELILGLLAFTLCLSIWI
ncbi:PMD domain-containing protein [Abeliophyllum distichum]|uniref:PMD domain-containing protein n=1 Tax=Abeliophyllum distichum TaxID=126358 RepID=A0ABD1QK24_9LAMI